jgi:hypothetical protein
LQERSVTLLEDDEGYPWTTSTHLFWIVSLLILTSGFSIFFLGIYLSLWIRSKGRSALPLAAFAAAFLICCTSAAFEYWTLDHRLSGILLITSLIPYVVAASSLRGEIQAHFQTTEGWTPDFDFGFTLVGSAIYINYYLARGRVAQPTTLVSLNLSNPSHLRK